MINTLSFFWVTTRTSGNPSQVRDQCFPLQVHRCVQCDFQRRLRGSRLSNGEATRRKVVLVDMSSAERGRSAEWKRGVLLLSFWKVAFLGPNRRPSSEGSGLAVKSLGSLSDALWREARATVGDKNYCQSFLPTVKGTFLLWWVGQWPTQSRSVVMLSGMTHRRLSSSLEFPKTAIYKVFFILHTTFLKFIFHFWG